MSDINFAALAAPIPAHAVKSFENTYKDKKTGKGKTFTVSYITARTVMNRLDGVVGPGNWYDRYETLEGGTVKCTLYIQCAPGLWIGKQDVGVESNIEEDKGAHSDAFKRAAVKWGIGRELHGDGTVYAHLLKMQENGTSELPTQTGQEPANTPPEPPERPQSDGSTPAQATTPARAETPENGENELDAHFGKRNGSEPVGDEADPNTGFEDLSWVRDRQAINNMVKWAREKLWDHVPINHARNRILKALGLENTGDFGLDIARYVGTKQQAMQAISAYIPGGDQSALVDAPEKHTSESDA